MASMMMQDHVPAKVIQERLGHTQISTTMDIYAHVQPGMQEDAARRHAARLHG
jgi:integrase